MFKYGSRKDGTLFGKCFDIKISLLLKFNACVHVMCTFAYIMFMFIFKHCKYFLQV